MYEIAPKKNIRKIKKTIYKRKRIVYNMHCKVIIHLRRKLKWHASKSRLQ